MRENSKRFKIPVEQGIVSMGTGLERGIVCQAIQNLVHNYVSHGSAVIPGWSRPYLPLSGVTLPDADRGFGAGFFMTTAGSFRPLGACLDTSTTPDKVSLYNLETQTKIGTPGQLLAENLVEPFCFTYLSHNTAPLTFLASREVAGGIWKYDGTSLTSYSHAVMNPAKVKGAVRAYLLRLWFTEIQNEGSTFLFFTDVLDTTTVRVGNFLRIPDAVNVLGIASAGDLDISAQSHLIVGCDASIWVIDGAPQTGTLVRRTLSTTVGIRYCTNVAETDFGMFLYGTDHMLYLIPRGAPNLVPIGHQILDILASPPNPNQVHLSWSTPYLFVGIGSNMYLGDFSNPQQPLWWGPCSLLTPMKGYTRGSEEATAYYLGFDGKSYTTSQAFQADVSPSAIRTGQIAEPGHDVQFGRITLKGKKKLNSGTDTRDFQVKVVDENDQVFMTTIAIPADATPTNKFFKASATLPVHVRGRHFYILLDHDTAAGALNWSPNFEEIEVEYRTIPRMD